MAQKFKFTEAKIKSLPIPNQGDRTIFADTETRGLCVRVMPTGTKTFFIRRKFNGKSERITLGRHPETSVPKARKIAASMHLLMDAGENPNDKKRSARQELIFAEFFDIYMVQHVNAHNKRPDDTRAEYRRYIAKPLGKKRLSAVTKAQLVELHAKLGKEIGHRTANKAHALIRAIFNRAIEWGYLEKDNPAKGIKRFREEKRDRFLSADEMKHFLVALEKESNETMRDFFLTLLFTGARSGEARSMRWDTVDLKASTWLLESSFTKNREKRIVVLPSPLVSILAIRQESAESDYVFSSPSQSGYIQEPKKAWRRILEEAEIADFRIHDLRHTFASWMVAQDVPLPVIQKALGHKDLSSTSIYTNTSLEQQKENIEKTAQKISTYKP